MYGTRVCHHMDESGVIKDGKMIGKRLMIRGMLEDGSMCFFTAITSNNVKRWLHMHAGWRHRRGRQLPYSTKLLDAGERAVRGRLVRWFVTGMLAAMILGCSVGAPRPAGVQSHPAADVVASDDADSERGAPRGVTGVWEGLSLGGRAAMRYITLTLVQLGSEVTGYYKCAYGNQLCRNMNETGVIKDGKMIGRRLMMRVMLEDGSMCYFTGVPQGDKLQGAYFCMYGAGGEGGRFRTERSY